VPPYYREGRELGSIFPSNTKSPGPRPTSIPSGIVIHPAVWPQWTLAENWGLCPFLSVGGAGSPCNRMSSGLRPTSVRSGILIHLAIFGSGHGPKIGVGCAPFVGLLGPHLTQCGLAESYVHAKFHLDPSDRLATIHQCHTVTDRTDLTDRTGQWSDSIG